MNQQNTHQHSSLHQNEAAPESSADETMQKLETQNQEYLNGWKRALADYDNFRKDTSDKIARVRTDELISLFHEIIPTIELYENALKHVPEEYVHSPWYTGLLHIKKKFTEFMSNHGITKIEALGTLFNPELHEAIDRRADHSKQDDEVLEVVRNGYRMHASVIEPAQVIVNAKAIEKK